MAQTRVDNPGAKPANPLAALLRAWWNGAENQAARPATDPAAAGLRAETDDTPVDPLTITQQLWGPGFVLPGGTARVLDLVKPLGVNPAMSLLDLSAGLGGPSRHISHTFDVYITGLERSEVLAQRGNSLSVEQGFGRKVPISHYDPETAKLRPRAFDCTYAQLLTWAVADKDRLFNQMKGSLKPQGQLTFTDFVLLQGNADDPTLARMRQVEPYPMHPWRRNQYLQALSQVGLDCRIAQDITEQFRLDVLEGWSNLVKTADLRGASKRTLVAVLDNAELWVRRLAAIEAGVLGVYRFYAISAPPAIR